MMQKAFLLFMLVTSVLFANQPSSLPKLYQSLWPNFCNDHLRERNTCSETYPIEWDSFWEEDIDYEGNSTWAEFLFCPFFARIDIDQTQLIEYQDLIAYLPKLSTDCAYHYCKKCGQSVKKSLGLYGQDPEFHDYVMHYSCDCLSRVIDLTYENYSTCDFKEWPSCKNPTIPFAYFNRFTAQYCSFLRKHLELCQESPLCECYWPYVSDIACKISNLVYDQIYELFQNPCIPKYKQDSEEKTFYEEYSSRDLNRYKEEFELRVLQNHFIFAFFYSNYHSIILNLCNYVDNNSLTAPDDLNRLYSILCTIRPLFLNLYSTCLEKHPHSKIFYERGMVHFHNGNLFAALSDIKNFMNSIDDDALLSSDLHLQEGASYAELGLYDKAIESLTKSIRKDPTNKEAYFERASLYFETGDFERSIQDYLESDFKTSSIDKSDFSSIAFAKMLISGMKIGVEEAITNFLPALMTSVNGLSHGLWIFASDPQNCSKEIVNACKELLQVLSNNSSIKILETFIPEIKELHNGQTDEEKAHLLGLIVGKYGTETFAPLGLIKAYKKIRSANRLLTLECLAKRSKESQILIETANNWNKTHVDSIEKFKIGEMTLKTYKGQFLTETTARKIIHEAGFPTFPRPKGIPDNFRVQLSNKGCGIKYVHPSHTYESIRVMPGKPHSPHPHQQKPYITHHTKDGLSYDKYGNKVPQNSIEAHISLEEFIYRSDSI